MSSELDIVDDSEGRIHKTEVPFVLYAARRGNLAGLLKIVTSGEVGIGRSDNIVDHLCAFHDFRELFEQPASFSNIRTHTSRHLLRR